MSEEEYSEYISDKLFSKIKPVIFTDLINKFKCGPNKAKSEMYTYYKKTKNVKFQCVIVACYANDTIKIVNDLNYINDQDNMTDCFIYAFNPMDVFNAVNDTIVNYENLRIQNPNKIKIIESKDDTELVPTRAKTLDNGTSNNSNNNTFTNTTKRSNTVPAKSNPGNVVMKDEPKKKEEKLRPTELLAKMRKERQEKEANRQEELKKRKEEQEQERLKKDPETVAQMKELKDIFDSDDLDDYESDEPSKAITKSDIANESSPQKSKTGNTKTTINASDLEEILDTTGEESLLMLSQNQSNSNKKEEKKEEEEEVSTYMDEDGYMVTKKTSKKPVPVQPETKRKIQLPSSKEPITKKTKAVPTKKKQGSLDFFFKKK